MTKADKKLKRERRERRFFPRPTASATVVYAIGGVGALVLGAGAWAQWLRVAMTSVDSSAPYGTWVLAAGIVLLGVAIWCGTSGEPTLRAGDGGVALEKGGIKRIPWYGVESVSYEGASASVVVKGHDEGGGEMIVRARVASHPQAAAWIVREARKRVPAVVSIGDEVALPATSSNAGERVTLDPIQVVGKRCAASRTILAFEPDARVCSRCERIYHKDHVPQTCECGGPLAASKETTSPETPSSKGEVANESESDASTQESHA